MSASVFVTIWTGLLLFVAQAEEPENYCQTSLALAPTEHKCNEFQAFRRCVFDRSHWVTSVEVGGSLTETKIVCNDPKKVHQIAKLFSQGAKQAKSLVKNQVVKCRDAESVVRKWRISSCGGTPELSVDSPRCRCLSDSPFTARPCVGGNGGKVFGGIGKTCSASPQILRMRFTTDLKWKTVEKPILCGESRTNQIELRNLQYKFELKYDALVTIDACSSTFDASLFIKDPDHMDHFVFSMQKCANSNAIAYVKRRLSAGAYVLGVHGANFRQRGTFTLTVSCASECTGSGFDYRGSKTSADKKCVAWSEALRLQFPSAGLIGNRCRNPPNSLQDHPWCPLPRDGKKSCVSVSCKPESEYCDKRAILGITNSHRIQNRCNVIESGQTCEVLCKPGYAPHGGPAVCGGGEWRFLPQCLLKDVYCSQKSRSYGTAVILAMNVTVGHSAPFACKLGYTHSPRKQSGFRKCVSSSVGQGIWSPEKPDCVVVEHYCSIEHAEHADISPATSVQLNENVRVECIRGFEFENPDLGKVALRKCTSKNGNPAAGTWDGGIPICREIEHREGELFERTVCHALENTEQNHVTLKSIKSGGYLKEIGHDGAVETSPRRVGQFQWKIKMRHEGVSIQNIASENFLAISGDVIVTTKTFGSNCKFQITCDIGSSRISLQTVFSDQYLYATKNGALTLNYDEESSKSFETRISPVM